MNILGITYMNIDSYKVIEMIKVTIVTQKGNIKEHKKDIYRDIHFYRHYHHIIIIIIIITFVTILIKYRIIQ